MHAYALMYNPAAAKPIERQDIHTTPWLWAFPFGCKSPVVVFVKGIMTA